MSIFEELKRRNVFRVGIAYAFEMTPEGIKKEKDVDRSQSITNTTGRKEEARKIAGEVLSFAPDFPEDATLSYPKDIVFMLVSLGEFEAALVIARKNRDYFSHIVLTRLRNDRSANGLKFYGDPRVQELIEQTDVPPLERENICTLRD